MRIDFKNLVYQEMGAGGFRKFDNLKLENVSEENKPLVKKYEEIRNKVIEIIRKYGGRNIREGANRYELVFDISDDKKEDLIEELKKYNIRIMSGLKEFVFDDGEIRFNIPVYNIKTLEGDEVPVKFRGINLDKGKYFWGYASVSVPDTQGDLIEKEALKEAARSLVKPPYNKIFLGHNYKDVAIGKIIYADVDDKGLLILAKLNENHSKADEVWKSIKEGYLDSFSVGGEFKRVVKEWDENLKRWINKVKEVVLREVSLTSMPANPHASIMGAFQKVKEVDKMEDVGFNDLVEALVLDMQEEKAGKKSPYLNPDGTFKGGFDGCVKHFMHTKGLSEERARALCAYIGRRTGKIKESNVDNVKEVDIMEEKTEVVEEKKQELVGQSEEIKKLWEAIKQLQEQIAQLTTAEKDKKEEVKKDEIVEEKKSLKVPEKKFANPVGKTENDISFLEWLMR